METSQKKQLKNKEREKELKKEISTLESLLYREREELRELQSKRMSLSTTKKRKREGESIAEWIVGC